MTGYSDVTIWLIIVVMAVGTFAIRFSFLGLFGRRSLPIWLLRYLRYTPVAMIPALMAPAVVWPASTGGTPDPARLVAAAVTVLVGYFTRSVIGALAAGGLTFAGFLMLAP